jgi:hypothetical protein
MWRINVSTQFSDPALIRVPKLRELIVRDTGEFYEVLLSISQEYNS